MKYHICCEGDIIASFASEDHRNYCLETFKDVDPDCTFYAKDDNEDSE